jgi:3-hydroxyisobutyrate dehydrogenase
VIDMSTSPPSLARRLAAALADRDVDFLDAPVSGGPHGAEDATLTIMVGGGEEAFQRAQPVLSCLGSLVVRAGPHGAGQTVKLLNNLLAGVTMAGIAEACAIAEREGVDPALMYELVSASTGDSRVLRTRFPLPGVEERHPANRDYEAMFTIDLIEKDLQLVRQLGIERGIRPTMVDAALAGYHDAQAAGLGTLDYSAVFLARRPDENAPRVLEGS